ncbi:dynamin family protein [Microcoleus sp. ZQ-A2]
MLADGTVTDEEKQRWQKSINKFIPPEGNVRQLTQLLSKGVRQNQVYKKLNDLLTLTAPLSESERLLLIGFGYEMSAADGVMDAREKKYLEVIANRLRINPRHLAVLEAGFTHQGTVEPSALDEVQSLLNPARFHELDSVFVKAASDMLATLPAKPEHKGTQAHRASSYQQLKEFQKYRNQLDNLCNQVFQIIQDCADSGFLPETLTEEIGKVSQKLQSQRFRLAVLGEFSQGKSTLLNALLGKDIQPVREIPCSGTVTVLRYGTQKRVVCRYRDGREEEIPFDQYKEKAAIPEEAALGDLSDELAQSEIDEIVVEHSDLDLCSSGVEIIDSPGLNENPARTAITQKLLKDIDAAIFLTNASRSLTQGERDLLQDLKSQLNGGVPDKPADNLFVVGNFMDLVTTEKGREQVQQRIKRFVQGQNPIVAGENRVHFISAQLALKALLKGTEDEWVKRFQEFTQSIEKFLSVECGSLKFQQVITRINDLIQSSFDGLHQAKEVLDGKISLSEADKHKILEQIGEASGRDVRIRLLANELVDEVMDEVNTSWDLWVEGLVERLAEKLEHWSSEHNAIMSRDELIKDYANQFNKDLATELDNWIENQLKQAILKHKLEIFDHKIRQELLTIKSDIEELNQQVNASSINWIFYGEEKNSFAANIGILGDLGLAGLGAALLIPAFVFAGPILGVIGGLVGGGLLGGGLGNILDINSKVKAKVFEVGCEKFAESLEDNFEKISEIIGSAFNEKVELADEIITKAISFYENLLEQQDKAHKETVEQRQAEKAWISQKRQELEQVQKNIEAILPS